jgi:adenosylcobinamide kinase / adenosylcobinamide-phosphate guanylyltransferase
VTDFSTSPQPLGRLILVTGPSRSGKSAWAEALATQSGQSVVYIATSINNPDDLEWQARVKAHCDRRPPTFGKSPTTLPQRLAKRHPNTVS